jgi:putative membrane protein
VSRARSARARRPARARLLPAPAWTEEGVEPDYRYTLANERTFLAWLRTALAMMAGALAVTQLLPPFALRGLISSLLAAAGCLLSAGAYLRWVANQRAMRGGRPLPHTPALLVLSATLSLIGVVSLVVTLVSAP